MMPKRKPNSIKPVQAGIPIRRVPENFPIIGIGASAGGLEALEQFFRFLPKDSGMAIVVIQHLDPNHVGIMPELLQRMTPVKVIQASDRLKVKPNTVYVIPPNKSMSLLNGMLHLFDPVEGRGLRLPIDIFFRSLADDRQDRSIGIILSGMGSDGSLGLKAIKEKNGLVLVQEPSSAKFDSMPRNAIELVVADIIAPANELPTRLIDSLAFLPKARYSDEIELKNSSNLEKIIILLRDYSGHDFSMYKKNTLFRRIERRKGVHQINRIQDYVHFLQENPSELSILYNELLIGVTSFFRDVQVWEQLKQKFLPELIESLPDGHLIRAWIAGCSTGEEAYSLAIIFREVMEKMKRHRSINLQIFATDLDHEAIEKARKGIFKSNICSDVSEARINRYFTGDQDGFRVISAIREMIVFAPQNLIKDAPFTRLDLVSCRNLLIYIEPELQNRLIGLFHYTLNPGGLLVLGTAETCGVSNEGFKDLDAKLKIYQRSNQLLLSETVDFPASPYHYKPSLTEKKIMPKPFESIQLLADQILLQQFAPPSVLVNNKGDILYITGRTGKYLEPVAGKANWNIHAMTREGLRQVFPGAFRKALQQHGAVVVKNIKVSGDGKKHFINITVQCLESPDALKGMIMVVFHDLPDTSEALEKLPKTGKGKRTMQEKKLEEELQQGFEELQSTREEMQTSQEELKSINEEMQSTNEELQSTNEELTTSKEEMQSLNEELQTVNQELQSKVAEYMRANDDMKNLLNSTEIATLFLDRKLNIRRFTHQVTKIFKLRDTDIGRPLGEIVNDLHYPEMDNHAHQVLESLLAIELAIETNDGRWFNTRIMPYRTLDDFIDGVVLTFTDITVSKKLENELKLANEALSKQQR